MVMCKRHPLCDQIQTERDKCVIRKYEVQQINSTSNYSTSVALPFVLQIHKETANTTTPLQINLHYPHGKNTVNSVSFYPTLIRIQHDDIQDMFLSCP